MFGHNTSKTHKSPRKLLRIYIIHKCEKLKNSGNIFLKILLLFLYNIDLEIYLFVPERLLVMFFI